MGNKIDIGLKRRVFIVEVLVDSNCIKLFFEISVKFCVNIGCLFIIFFNNYL